MKRDEAIANVGGMSNPSKMPCLCWSTPAKHCGTGSLLRGVEGTTCSSCYAAKGCYTFRSTVGAMDRRWSVLTDALASPESLRKFIDSFVCILDDRYRRTMRAIARNGEPGRDDGRVFRWHDSGDIQGERHFAALCEIAARCPEVKFWLPTREAGTVRSWIESGNTIPTNLCVRLSLPRVGAEVAPVFRRLAEHPQVSLSGVHEGDDIAEGFGECNAYQNEGACGDCRACWDPAKDVSYPLH